VQRIDYQLIAQFVTGEISTSDLERLIHWMMLSEENRQQVFLLEQTYQRHQPNPYANADKINQAQHRLFRHLSLTTEDEKGVNGHA
jgi:hypothetical protein